MHLEAKNFFLHDLFIYGFPHKSRIAGNGSMEVTAEKIFAEDNWRVRPAGKSLVVRSINFAYPRPLEHSAKREPSYAGLFRRNNKNSMGGGGIILERDNTIAGHFWKTRHLKHDRMIEPGAVWGLQQPRIC